MHQAKEKSRYADVMRIFHMVNGIYGMLILSVLIRLFCKLSVVMVVVLTAAAAGGVIEGTISDPGRWGAGLGAVVLAVVGTSYLDTFVSHDCSFRIIKQLQGKLYDHMDRIAPGGLEGINSADTAMVLLSDINVFEWFFAHCLVEWIGTFMTLAVCILLLGRISPGAGVAVVISLGFMMAIPFLSIEQAKQKGLVMKRLFGALNGIVSDGVSGEKDVIAFRWSGSFYKRLDAVSTEYSQAQGKFAARGEWEKTAEAMVACLAILAGILLCWSGTGHNQLSLLLVAFALVTGTVNCIQGTLAESTNFGFVFGASARIAAILDIEPTVSDSGKKSFQEVQNKDGWTLEFRNVSFQYSDGFAPLLRDVSFRADAPEIVAIVAASGGGKTTLAKLLQRFWDVDSGAIYMNDTDIRDMTLHTLREAVTVVPQETYLFHGSIRDNLLLIKPDATEKELEDAVKKARADSFIRKLDHGMDTIVGATGVMLSGGERQRIALAQAFLKKAPILVLDEATSALDTENEKRMNEAIRADHENRLTIVIAHRLSSMAGSDRIVFLKDGTVMRTGTYQELMNGCEEFRDLVKGEYCEE